MRKSRVRSLAKACNDLDPAEERALADEGLAIDTASWPQYLIGAFDSAQNIPSGLSERHDDYLYIDPVSAQEPKR
jgi:hypothetical protein